MASDMASTINSVSVELHRLAESKEVESVKTLLHETADRIQGKMEVWHETVDAWIAKEVPALDAARRAAFADFREELARGRTILEAHRV